jgi:hypothetical protein
MSTTDYLIDSVLVLLVLLQIREQKLTTRMLVRPLIIVGIAVASYLNGFPTAGNDLVLVAAFALIGGLLGLASGQTVLMRRDVDGGVLARSGWASAFFWVLGMGSRSASSTRAGREPWWHGERGRHRGRLAGRATAAGADG